MTIDIREMNHRLIKLSESPTSRFIAVGDAITIWSDDAARQASVARLSPQARQTLDQLDREYYKCPEDLTPLLYNYVTKHRAEVRARPTFEW
jgi:hypothetical protein